MQSPRRPSRRAVRHTRLRGGRSRRPRRCPAPEARGRPRGDPSALYAPSSAMSPSTAIVLRPSATWTRCSSAARIETGLAFQASFTSTPPPGSGISWLRHSVKGTCSSGGISSPSARAVARAVSAFAARCRAEKSTSTLPTDVRKTGGSNASSVTSTPHPDDVDVFARDGEVRGDDRDTARREGGDQLALRPDDSGEITDLLEVHRPDVRDHADIGPRERRELGDLVEATHCELEDAELGVLFDAADRERHAYLGVVASLRRDRPFAVARRSRRGCPWSRSSPSSR